MGSFLDGLSACISYLRSCLTLLLSWLSSDLPHELPLTVHVSCILVLTTLTLNHGSALDYVPSYLHIAYL